MLLRSSRIWSESFIPKRQDDVLILLINSNRGCYWQAGAGNVIGSTFRELGEIIKLVKDKTRVGVCLDTCTSNCLAAALLVL